MEDRTVGVNVFADDVMTFLSAVREGIDQLERWVCDEVKGAAFFFIE